MRESLGRHRDWLSFMGLWRTGRDKEFNQTHDRYGYFTKCMEKCLKVTTTDRRRFTRLNSVIKTLSIRKTFRTDPFTIK